MRKREQEISQETIQSKNTELDIQRIKLKRYEFALKEAMLFLNKPIASYEGWLNEASANSGETLKKALSGAIQSSKKDTQDKSSKVAPVEELSEMELVSLECLRIARNYLDNAQKYVDNVDNGTIQFQELQPLVVNENEALLLRNDKETPRSSIASSARHSRANVRELNEPFSDTEESDVGMGTRLAASIPTPTGLKCDKCREWMIRCDKLNDLKTELDKKVAGLEKELEKESKAKKRLQDAKDLMDQELEDLTSTLFDQANHMVIKESRIRDDLNTKNKDLAKKLASLNDRFKAREQDIVDLKKALYQTEQVPVNDSISRKPSASSGAVGFTHTVISGYDEFRTHVAVDGILFQEFQEHIRATMVSLSAPNPASHLSTNFIKRCMAEDVEPSLFYNYQLGSLPKQYGTGLSQSLKKKFIEAVTKAGVEVRMFKPPDQVIHESKATLEIPEGRDSVRMKTSFAFKDKCFVCTILRDCEYEIAFKVADKSTKQEWIPLCRFCRDRTIASLDFFTFLEHLRKGVIGPGKSGATILSLFKQLMWLRRRINLAKVGSCSLFETEVSSLLGPGDNGDWEKYIAIIS